MLVSVIFLVESFIGLILEGLNRNILTGSLPHTSTLNNGKLYRRNTISIKSMNIKEDAWENDQKIYHRTLSAV